MICVPIPHPICNRLVRNFGGMVRVPEQILARMLTQLEPLHYSLATAAVYSSQLSSAAACHFTFRQCLIKLRKPLVSSPNSDICLFREFIIENLENEIGWPYLDGWSIICLRKELVSKSEYLNPLSWSLSFVSSWDKARLCRLASNDASPKQLPLVSGLSILSPGRHPSGGKLRNANFLPPLSCIPCPKWIQTCLDQNKGRLHRNWLKSCEFAEVKKLI